MSKVVSMQAHKGGISPELHRHLQSLAQELLDAANKAFNNGVPPSMIIGNLEVVKHIILTMEDEA